MPIRAPRGWLTSSHVLEEVEHPAGEERSGLRVVRRQRAVGEVVLITGVEEQLGVVDVGDDLPSRVDVSLPDEDGVRVHAVDLDGDSVGPRAEGPVTGDRNAGVEQQRAASPGPGLRELLSRHLPEREPGVDEVARQVLGAANVPLQDLVESDFSGVAMPSSSVANLRPS